MEVLYEYSRRRSSRISTAFVRDERYSFPWEVALLGIEGARGIGKTTMFLQHMLANKDQQESIYLSLDHIYFTEHKLVDVADAFYRRGGRRLYIDEVHKYPNWSLEIKNIHDLYGDDLKIAFTGSSMSYIQSGNADLSRRAIMRRMQGLSFRQFINLKMLQEGKSDVSIKQYTLDEILNNTDDITNEIKATGISIFPLFHEYLKYGYYPFFLEGLDYFPERLNNTIRAVLESDFALLHNVSANNVRSIYQLLYAIATSPPFQPNIERISKRIGIARTTLLEYIHHLSRADILALLKDPKKGLSTLKKPNKIYLENPNVLYNFEPNALQLGTLRETFVVNQLKYNHAIHYPKKGDVLVDEKYTFEIGGKEKGYDQIKEIKYSFVLSDDIDIRVGNKLPMWLMGLMY